MPNRKEILAWCMYDFANSAYATTIAAVIFNVYFVKVAVGEAGAKIWGFHIPGEALWGYTVSLSMLVICLTAPIVGAIADYSASKKKFLMVYTYIPCVLTILMYYVSNGDYLLAMLFFGISNIGFDGGSVFYNAFLTEIAEEKNMGRVSGFGWALGYIGGGLCLALNLAMIQKPDWFGISATDNIPVRLSLVVAGLWWAVFSIPTFLWVREGSIPLALPAGETYLGVGFKRVRKALKEIRHYPELFKFLLAYLVYNDGVQTVIVMGSVFGAVELKMSEGELIQCFLMVQAVAFVGSLLFGYLGDRLGSKQAINLTLWTWTVVVASVFFIKTSTGYWYLAAAIGLVLGGNQAASRTLLGLFTPKENSAEFFGFFAVSGRFVSLLGPLLFGISRHASGNIRVAVLSLLVFFVAGLILMHFVDEKRGIADGRAALI